MKDVFSEYKKLTNGELRKIFKEGLFVFDTNVLLGLYRYPKKTRRDFISTIRKIGDRIWIPYQVGIEYNRSRRSERYKVEGKLNEIIELLKKSKVALRESLSLFSKSYLSETSFLTNIERSYEKEKEKNCSIFSFSFS